jgi:hypothetical protein
MKKDEEIKRKKKKIKLMNLKRQITPIEEYNKNNF